MYRCKAALFSTVVCCGLVGGGVAVPSWAQSCACCLIPTNVPEMEEGGANPTNPRVVSLMSYYIPDAGGEDEALTFLRVGVGRGWQIGSCFFHETGQAFPELRYTYRPVPACCPSVPAEGPGAEDENPLSPAIGSPDSPGVPWSADNVWDTPLEVPAPSSPGTSTSASPRPPPQYTFALYQVGREGDFSASATLLQALPQVQPGLNASPMSAWPDWVGSRAMPTP